MSYITAVKFQDQSGTPYGVKHINNKPRVSAMPYLYDIAEKNVSGHWEWERFGYNGDIDIVEEDIWAAGGTYVFPAAAQQMELVSTSANDAAAGTGIRSVTLYYLTDTFVEKTEDITLNGTTVVTTTANDIYRVNALKAKTVGTGGTAAGTITIRNLADTPVYSQISQGQTRSRNSIYTVPYGRTLYITSMLAGCAGGAGFYGLVTLRATWDHDADAARSFFLPHAEMLISTSTVYQPFELPLRFPAGTDIKCSASTGQNNTIVNVALRGWLEE